MRALFGLSLCGVLGACGDSDPVIDAPQASDSKTADASIDSPPVPNKRVFVTSTRYPGDLKTAGAGTDGLEGGDKLCNTRALAAGLGGTWGAWLSSSTVNAIDRISDVGRWYLVDNTTLVFPSKASIASLPMNAIKISENGVSVAGETAVWTGTAVTGTVVANNTCSDWTTSSDAINGKEGLLTEVDKTWTEYLAVGVSCLQQNRLYCFEK